MRKNLIVSLFVVLCIVILSFACVKENGGQVKTKENLQKQAVVTVAKNENSGDMVLKTRFLNMLNHNFVYNDAFYSDAELVKNSMTALLDKSEDSFLNKDILSDFIFNMYGKKYTDFGFLGGDLPKADESVYIVPCGYSEYTHSNIAVTDNCDGSYTVITDVVIADESNFAETFKCETLFIKADDSAFGYNILYSDIIEFAGEQADC